jgi:hypothetical protein
LGFVFCASPHIWTLGSRTKTAKRAQMSDGLSQ